MGSRTAAIWAHGDGYDQLHSHSLANRFRKPDPVGSP